MKPQKLLKLLVEFEDRLRHLQNAIIAIEGPRGASRDTVDHLTDLRAQLRRYQSKVDTLRLSDIEGLEKRVDVLQRAAAKALAKVGTSTPYSNALSILAEANVLTNFTNGLRIGLIQLEPDEIIDALPGQKPAAFKFAFDGNVLKVIDQPLQPSEREREMAMAALEAAVDDGVHVIFDLSATNASPRLKDAFSRLQETMGSYKNIVQVGARAQICSRLVHANSDELSSTLVGLLLGHIGNIYSALAQFEEWREYSENAASINLDRKSIADLSQSTSALIDQMQTCPVVDPQVAEALETVNGWVNEQEEPDKRDVLSLTRTLENLWSVVVKSTLSVLRETVSEARKAAAKIILTGMVFTAACSVPVISKVPGGEWVQVIYNYLKSVGTEAAK